MLSYSEGIFVITNSPLVSSTGILTHDQENKANTTAIKTILKIMLLFFIQTPYYST